MPVAGSAVLIDTNIAIALMRRDAAVLKALPSTIETFVSVVTIGELYFGAFKSVRQMENLEVLQDFQNQFETILVTEDTARIYGTIKGQLRGKGRPIPENDIWIAAVAKENDLILASRDAHFDFVEGLQRATWIRFNCEPVNA
jgi:tRNA(fMet)-specific endonuclease VapC